MRCQGVPGTGLVPVLPLGRQPADVCAGKIVSERPTLGGHCGLTAGLSLGAVRRRSLLPTAGTTPGCILRSWRATPDPLTVCSPKGDNPIHPADLGLVPFLAASVRRAVVEGTNFVEELAGITPRILSIITVLAAHARHHDWPACRPQCR